MREKKSYIVLLINSDDGLIENYAHGRRYRRKQATLCRLTEDCYIIFILKEEGGLCVLRALQLCFLLIRAKGERRKTLEWMGIQTENLNKKMARLSLSTKLHA